jgi:protein SDA1
VWTDARTVNVLGSACLSPLSRVMVAAVHFFLGIETKMHDDDEEEKV